MARVRAILVALALCLTCAGTADASARLLGANIQGAPDDVTQLQSFVQKSGRAPDIVMWYQSWSEPLYWSKQMPATDSIGAEPLITWSPELSAGGVPLSDIVAGSYDAYITDQARLAKQYGKPMMIRFAHEMNLFGSAYGPGRNGNTAADFVAAWRHVVGIFRDQGATNVQWVWSPNVYCGGSCPFTAFYPGDAWTDWVALDGYNYSTVSGVPWMSLLEVFGPSYDILTNLTDKPLMIAETASAEAGGDKAAWIRQGLLHDVPEKLPRVRAVIWFDRVKETNWRIDSTPQSLAAWRDVVASPIYGGDAAGPSAITTPPLSTPSLSTPARPTPATPPAVSRPPAAGPPRPASAARSTARDKRAAAKRKHAAAKRRRAAARRRRAAKRHSRATRHGRVSGRRAR